MPDTNAWRPGRPTQRAGSRKKRTRRRRAFPPLNARHCLTAPLGNDSDPGPSATSGSAATAKRLRPTPTPPPPPPHVPLHASSSYANTPPPPNRPSAPSIYPMRCRNPHMATSAHPLSLPNPLPPPHNHEKKKQQSRQRGRAALTLPLHRDARHGRTPRRRRRHRRHRQRAAAQRASPQRAPCRHRHRARDKGRHGGGEGGGGTADATRVGVTGKRARRRWGGTAGERGEECAVIGRGGGGRVVAPMRVAWTTSTTARGDGGVWGGHEVGGARGDLASWPRHGSGCGGRAATPRARGNAAGRACATHPLRATPRRPGIGWRARVDLAGHDGGVSSTPTDTKYAYSAS